MFLKDILWIFCKYFYPALNKLRLQKFVALSLWDQWDLQLKWHDHDDDYHDDDYHGDDYRDDDYHDHDYHGDDYHDYR